MGHSSHKIRFYHSPESECGYFSTQYSRSLVVNPFDDPDANLYSSLVTKGFRRSGSMIYRADCAKCNCCIPVRLRASEFQMKRRFRRTLAKNSNIAIRVNEPILTDEYFNLYKRYVNILHTGGSMTDPCKDDFENFLVTQNWSNALFMEFRFEKELIAVAVTDIVSDGFSCVYTFYNPLERHRAPGQFAILRQIEMTCEYQLPYLYLGYWIEDSSKMSYKSDYQPLEYYFNEKWMNKNEFEQLASSVMRVI